MHTKAHHTLLDNIYCKSKLFFDKLEVCFARGGVRYDDIEVTSQDSVCLDQGSDKLVVVHKLVAVDLLGLALVPAPQVAQVAIHVDFPGTNEYL